MMPYGYFFLFKVLALGIARQRQPLSALDYFINHKFQKIKITF